MSAGRSEEAWCKLPCLCRSWAGRGGEAREGEITINECFIKAKNLHSVVVLDGLALEHIKAWISPLNFSIFSAFSQI